MDRSKKRLKLSSRRSVIATIEQLNQPINRMSENEEEEEEENEAVRTSTRTALNENYSEPVNHIEKNVISTAIDVPSSSSSTFQKMATSPAAIKAITDTLDSNRNLSAIETPVCDHVEGPVLVPGEVMGMIRHCTAPVQTMVEILLDGCVPPLQLIPVPPEHNGIRYKWEITADKVARQIFKKAQTELNDKSKNVG